MDKTLSRSWDIHFNPIISKEKKQEMLAKLFNDEFEYLISKDKNVTR